MNKPIAIVCKSCGHQEEAHEYIIKAKEKSDQEQDPEILDAALEEVEGTEPIDGYVVTLADCHEFNP